MITTSRACGNIKKMKKEKTISNFLTTTKTAVSLAWKANPQLTLLYLFAYSISGITPAIGIWAGKHIIDSLISTGGTLGSPAFYSTLFYLCIALGASIFSNIMVTVRFLTHNRMWDLLMEFAHLELMKKSLELDISFFESADFYSQYEKVRQEIDSRLPATVNDVAELLRLSVEVVSVAIILVSIHWILLPIVIAINVPTLLWGMGFSQVKHNLSGFRVPEAKKADYIARLTTDKDSVKEVKLFNLGDYLMAKYRQFFTRLLDENWSLAKKQFIGAFLTTTVADLAYYGFYLFTIIQVYLERLSLGDVVLYTGAFNRASNSLGGMLRYTNSLYENSLYVNDFAKFLKLAPVLFEPENPAKLGKIMSIKFDHVWFRYKTEMPFVLEDVSFEVGDNENIALVGQNGAGKTTIVKLLMRFYDVTRGAIYINGKDIKEYKTTDLWNSMATIFQDFVKYQLTATENIAFGQLDKLHDAEAIQMASKKAEADTFISGLPQGYDTILGTRFEGGTDLSLGQWQRIALARAFLRNSSVIILDEPTASLDAKAEYEIFKKFTELTQGKTTFLISHRFSTVRLADRIIVVENGKLLEQGSHQELMLNNGRYAEMFNLQAEGYK